MSNQDGRTAAAPAPSMPRQASPDPRRLSESNGYGAAPTMWMGWIAFAGAMMIMLGAFHAIEGLVALFQDSYFLVGKNNLVVHVDYTTWGWVHLLGGVIVALAGVALFSGRMWARIVAVVCAFGSSLINIAFLSAYPIWSTIMITFDVLVIWAVTVHGSEIRKASSYEY